MLGLVAAADARLCGMKDQDVFPKGYNTARIFGGPKGLGMYVCGLTAELLY